MGVEGSRNYLVLLRLGKLNEVDGVSRYSYSELGIELGVLLRVEEEGLIEHVDVKMESSLCRISIKK